MGRDSARELLTLRGHPGAIHCLSYTGDGQLLAAGGIGAEVRVWDARPLLPEHLREATARRRVRDCLALGLLKEEVLDQLRQAKDLDEPTRARAIELVADFPEPSAAELNNRAWFLVHSSTARPENRAQALKLIRRAYGNGRDAGYLLNTMGLVLYRNELYGEAEKILEQSLRVNADPEGRPSTLDVVFLIMTQLRLGKQSEALARLERLKSQEKGQLASDPEAQGFLAEVPEFIQPKRHQR